MKPFLKATWWRNELHAYNRQWFRQAHNTPFGHGELYDFVGFGGLTEQADAIILENGYPDESRTSSISGRMPTTNKCLRDLGLHKPRGFQEMRSTLEWDYVYISLRSPSWTLQDRDSWWWGGATTCWYDQLSYHTRVCSGPMDSYSVSRILLVFALFISLRLTTTSSSRSFLLVDEWWTKPCREWPAACLST